MHLEKKKLCSSRPRFLKTKVCKLKLHSIRYPIDEKWLHPLCPNWEERNLSSHNLDTWGARKGTSVVLYMKDHFSSMMQIKWVGNSIPIVIRDTPTLLIFFHSVWADPAASFMPLWCHLSAFSTLFKKKMFGAQMKKYHVALKKVTTYVFVRGVAYIHTSVSVEYRLQTENKLPRRRNC